jgi:hypothetical protein
MLDVLRELVQRYGHHPSFAGVAIQLSADGYAQLPDASWGLDDLTVGRFQQAAGVELVADGPQRFQERFRQLTSPQLEPRWLDWRAKQLAAFYQRAQQVVVAQRPDARLYLSGARMFEGEAMQTQLRPTLPRRLTLKQTMVRVGIDPVLYADPESPVLLHGETVLPWTSLAHQSVSLELESMRKAEDLAEDFGATGTLFYHQPQETPLSSFDQLSPFQPSVTRLTTQAVPSASQNRRRFVRALAHFDPIVAVDGGLRMSLGQEDSLEDLVALYRRLPAVRFERFENESPTQTSSEPIVVRYLKHADSTYVVVVNEAGFPVKATVRLHIPVGCRLDELTGMRQVAPLRAGAAGTFWEVELDAYDAIGARLSSPQARVVEAKTEWSIEIDQALAARVSDLENRRRALHLRPRPWDELKNPGFEDDVLEGGQIPGWMFPPGLQTSVQVDDSDAKVHTGNRSLRLTSSDKPAVIVSHSFKAPKTGRLTVTMWLKSDKSDRWVPPLRIGVQKGRTYYSDGEVKAPIGNIWRPVVFSVDNLPQDGRSDLQLRIALNGPGQVWIDEITLLDLYFEPREDTALTKTIYPAGESLDVGEVLQCIRILESYWPRFLLEHVPPMEVAQAPQKSTPDRAEEFEDGQESDGFFRRFRNLVPQRLRF